MHEMVSMNMARVALFVALSLSTYLRPSSLLMLTSADLYAPVLGISLYWSLLVHRQGSRPSKTGEYDLSVVLDSYWLLFLTPVLELLQKEPPGVPVWGFGYPTVLSTLRQACINLGLKPVTPYQARHSGASTDRASNARTLLDIQKRGGWKTMKSVCRYEKGARLAQRASKPTPPPGQPLRGVLKALGGRLGLGEAHRQARRHQGWQVGTRVAELGSGGDGLADRIARGGCPCETFELGNLLADVQRWQKWIGRFRQRIKRRQVLALVVSTKAAGNRPAGQNRVRLQKLYALAAEAAQASVPVLWEELAREDFSEGRPLAPFSRQASSECELAIVVRISTFRTLVRFAQLVTIGTASAQRQANYITLSGVNRGGER